MKIILRLFLALLPFRLTPAYEQVIIQYKISDHVYVHKGLFEHSIKTRQSFDKSNAFKAQELHFPYIFLNCSQIIPPNDEVHPLIQRAQMLLVNIFSLVNCPRCYKGELDVWFVRQGATHF